MMDKKGKGKGMEKENDQRELNKAERGKAGYGEEEQPSVRVRNTLTNSEVIRYATVNVNHQRTLTDAISTPPTPSPEHAATVAVGGRGWFCFLAPAFPIVSVLHGCNFVWLSVVFFYFFTFALLSSIMLLCVRLLRLRCGISVCSGLKLFGNCTAAFEVV